MKLHKKVKSTEKPKDILIDKYSVWVASNVVEVEEVNDMSGEEVKFKSYEYDLKQYEKNEYIKELHEKNTNLETQLTDTQLALVEIYENMGV